MLAFRKGAGVSLRTVAYVNGTPVAATTTSRGFHLGSGGLRFFRDNVRGGTRGEQSGGALACLAAGHSAGSRASCLTSAARAPLRRRAEPSPPPHLPFKIGTYEGTTAQRLPVSLTVDQTTVQDFSFRWRAKCADGKVHTNGIGIGGGTIRHGRFSLGGTLNTGGHARVSGRLAGGRASGVLSRWGNSAFNTSCPDRGVRWHAHFVSAQGPLF